MQCSLHTSIKTTAVAEMGEKLYIMSTSVCIAIGQRPKCPNKTWARGLVCNSVFSHLVTIPKKIYTILYCVHSSKFQCSEFSGIIPCKIMKPVYYSHCQCQFHDFFTHGPQSHNVSGCDFTQDAQERKVVPWAVQQVSILGSCSNSTGLYTQ